jgi:hypothetical protein
VVPRTPAPAKPLIRADGVLQGDKQGEIDARHHVGGGAGLKGARRSAVHGPDGQIRRMSGVQMSLLCIGWAL